MKVFTFVHRDDEQNDVVHDVTGCTLLDNAGAYFPDARSAPLLERASITLERIQEVVC
jgi:DNA-binding sugar fermentation-stimulating protein